MSAQQEAIQNLISDVSKDTLTFLGRKISDNFRPESENLSLLIDDEMPIATLTKVGHIEYSQSEKLIVCLSQVERELTERSGRRACPASAHAIPSSIIFP